MREMRVSLTEDDFKELVAGRLVRKEGGSAPVVISLQDIGFDRMKIALQEASNGHDRKDPASH